MKEKTRQFIFRVWNITEKKFVMTGSLYACEGISSLSQPFNRNTHTIQQYTGINDVEDNPIYEGDIISLDLFDTKKRGKGIIVYDNGAFWAKANDTYYYFNDSAPKVLGNIFENNKLI